MALEELRVVLVEPRRKAGRQVSSGGVGCVAQVGLAHGSVVKMVPQIV